VAARCDRAILSRMELNVPSDDNCRLWVDRAGSGQPLVLCHGGPGLWDYLDDVAAILAPDARTIRWDQRGCGRSERRGPFTVARFVADLDAVREHSQAARVSLLGHSWGATLALRYALAHPDRVSRLIYVSGTGIDDRDTWRPAFQHNLDRSIGSDRARWKELDNRDRTPDEDREYAILQWSADFVDPATARQHAERMATPWPGINWDCAASINTEISRYLLDHDVRARCRTLTVPTLIVDGALDVRPRWAVDSLEQSLPNVHRVTLTDAGHLPWIENPDGFRRAVTGFLDGPDDRLLGRHRA
jgi:proline iminopeptidase